MAADEDIKTVMVKGLYLDKQQGDLCHLYFENERRGGGDIVEGAVIWNEEQKGFLITFKESHETTVDFIQNYLEYGLNLDVASVQVNGGDASALVLFEKPVKKIDVQEMEQACQYIPPDYGVRLSFCGVPVARMEAPISTVLVEGLKPETTSETVLYFFSNKRRNAGGPVERVDMDPGATTALVHFENAADAESVVKKGTHVIDGQSLTVSLHEASDPTDRPGQHTVPLAAPPQLCHHLPGLDHHLNKPGQ